MALNHSRCRIFTEQILFVFSRLLESLAQHRARCKYSTTFIQLLAFPDLGPLPSLKPQNSTKLQRFWCTFFGAGGGRMRGVSK